MLEIGEPVCVAPVGDICGEGPVWHEEEQSLYWTDINRFLIQRFGTKTESVDFWQFDEPVTALMLTNRSDTFAVALGSRLIFWKPKTDARHDHGFRLEGWPNTRLNDGRADPDGRLWLGSMRNNVNADGSAGEAGGADGVLYSIEPSGATRVWKTEIGISNTFAWSPDKRTFYFADTLANRLCAYDYNAETGEIGGEQDFLCGFERGSPDGSQVDSTGHLWNCRYHGSCIVRVVPNGAIERIVEMPVANITSCTFGGADRKTLFVTTARNTDRHERFGGGMFAIQTNVAGLPENRFFAFQ